MPAVIGLHCEVPREPGLILGDMREVDAFGERYAAGIRAAIESVRPWTSQVPLGLP
jgi:hypothetical protein